MGEARGFPAASAKGLADAGRRGNLTRATATIRERRATAVADIPDWEELREQARQIKERALRHLDVHLEALESAVQRANGVVHWARDGREANRLVAELVTGAGARSVIKAKSMTTEEIGLNAALAAHGIEAYETDLAELIVQLSGDRPSHIVVPAIHRNREEIRDLFRRNLPGSEAVGESPEELAEVARRFLRERFLASEVGITGANFAVAETGTIAIVESEGNARMCLTLPRMVITLMGIEKVLPRFADLAVMLRLLAPSATGERMNPYTSLWAGAESGEGPEEFHLVLLDNGRTRTLADPVGRNALHCIRCAACLNICPVYERAGGHAYDSTYPGPIGAILAPQLAGLEGSTSLPWASSLCGACYDVCPVKIDIPRLLVHMRGRVVREARSDPDHAVPVAERISMRLVAWLFSGPRRFRAARAVGRRCLRIVNWHPIRRIVPPPLRAWLVSRDLPPAPDRTFRDWWTSRETR
jgi:L-lactate dehydrogenase complex protein LldF